MAPKFPPREVSKKEFSKGFQELARQKGRGTVFQDFLDYALLMVGPPSSQAQLNSILATYQKSDELIFKGLFFNLMDYTCSNFDYSDFLGFFFETEIGTNARTGQFFTPESICDLMAASVIPEGTEFKTICDPCCGSGRNLLAAAKIAPQNLFFAADVDIICVKMCLLNFLLYGMQGEVAHMNTLSLDIYKTYFVNFDQHYKKIIAVEIPKEKSIFANKKAQNAMRAEVQEPLFLPPDNIQDEQTMLRHTKAFLSMF